MKHDLDIKLKSVHHYKLDDSAINQHPNCKPNIQTYNWSFGFNEDVVCEPAQHNYQRLNRKHYFCTKCGDKK